jgi:hypothetical protein
MSFIRIPIAAAVVLTVGALCPSTAFAQQAASGSPPDASRNGQQAASDAAGHLRQPTKEERTALAEQMRKMFEPSGAVTPAVRLPNGAVVVEMPEHTHSATVATVENGTLRTECVSSAAEGEAFLDGAAGHDHAIAEEK